jgi:hypothetical protein
MPQRKPARAQQVMTVFSMAQKTRLRMIQRK